MKQKVIRAWDCLSLESLEGRYSAASLDGPQKGLWMLIAWASTMTLVYGLGLLISF